MASAGCCGGTAASPVASGRAAGNRSPLPSQQPATADAAPTRGALCHDDEPRRGWQKPVHADVRFPAGCPVRRRHGPGRSSLPRLPADRWFPGGNGFALGPSRLRSERAGWVNICAWPSTISHGFWFEWLSMQVPSDSGLPLPHEPRQDGRDHEVGRTGQGRVAGLSRRAGPPVRPEGFGIAWLNGSQRAVRPGLPVAGHPVDVVIRPANATPGRRSLAPSR
jgi:hypothetical protein